jgi:hypothetical protein
VRALRRLFGFLLLAAFGFAAVVVYRRRFAARRERLDLYYEDGSLVSIEQGSDRGARLLPLAHDVLRAAQ